MGIFFGQRHRLERESWRGPSGAERLAKEILSIFSIQETVIDGPLKIVPNPDDPANTTPPLTIDLPTGSDTTTVIKINQDGGETGFVGPTGGGGGDQTVVGILPPGPSDKVFPSFMMIGQITAGSGSSYTATVWPYGVAGTGYVVSVTDLQVAASESIPVGTYLWVIGYPTSATTAVYYSLQPVYISDT
jgi:hypothetical protein